MVQFHFFDNKLNSYDLGFGLEGSSQIFLLFQAQILHMPPCTNSSVNTIDLGQKKYVFVRPLVVKSDFCPTFLVNIDQEVYHSLHFGRCETLLDLARVRSRRVFIVGRVC